MGGGKSGNKANAISVFYLSSICLVPRPHPPWSQALPTPTQLFVAWSLCVGRAWEQSYIFATFVNLLLFVVMALTELILIA